MNQPLDPLHTKIAVEIIATADDHQLAQIEKNIHERARGLMAAPISEPYGKSKWRITFDLLGRDNTHLKPEHVGDWVLGAGLKTVDSVYFTFLNLQ